MSAPTVGAADPGTRAATGRALVGCGLVGLGAVAVAAVVGWLLALALAALGLTDTGPASLGAWLAGTGLLGGWRQTVSATVAGGLEWSTWAAGAPLLVTFAVIGCVTAAARRSGAAPITGAMAAAAGAAVAAAVLVALSQTAETTTNAAGSVTRSEGLTWLWTGDLRPGTLVGAAALVGVTWWVATAGRGWWRAGRAAAYGLLLWPGLVLSLVAAAGIAYLTSSPAVGIATLLLFPLLGVLVLLGLAGVPVEVGVTRLSPAPYVLDTWSAGPVYAVAGLVVVLALAVVVGLVLRRRRHRGGWLPFVTVPAATAAFVCWASGTSVVVPDSLGGPTRVGANALLAAVAAAVLAAVALAVRGRSDVPSSDEPDDATDV